MPSNNCSYTEEKFLEALPMSQCFSLPGSRPFQAHYSVFLFHPLEKFFAQIFLHVAAPFSSMDSAFRSPDHLSLSSSSAPHHHIPLFFFLSSWYSVRAMVPFIHLSHLFSVCNDSDLNDPNLVVKVFICLHKSGMKDF